MNDLILPYFSHPTRVIFIDDNRSFLDAIELEFGSNINIATFNNPKDGLQALSNNAGDARLLFNIDRNHIEVDTISNNGINFNIHNVLNRIYNPNRFSTTTVLVVDYQMPDINGIELCRMLKKSPVLKIMLTAEADKDIAIKAFNDRIIDKFLMKTSKNIYQQLTHAINELTMVYFNRLSLHISGTDHLLTNQMYKQLFNKVLMDTNAVEYYKINYSGGYLFLNKNAVPTWLIVYNEKEMDEQVALLEGYAMPVSAIQNREKMLFLFSEAEHKKPAVEWTNYFLDAMPLDNDHCYCIITNKLTEFIKWDRIVSYADFMNQ